MSMGTTSVIGSLSATRAALAASACQGQRCRMTRALKRRRVGGIGGTMSECNTDLWSRGQTAANETGIMWAVVIVRHRHVLVPYHEAQLMVSVHPNRVIDHVFWPKAKRWRRASV